MTKEQIDQLRCIPIVVLLERMGAQPSAKHAKGVWFKAPWRDEQEASLKVDTDRNLWYDFGESVGGDVIKLAEHQWGKDFLEACKLLRDLMGGYATDPTTIARHAANRREKPQPVKMDYLEEQPITSNTLLEYLRSRGIDSEIASDYCIELHYGRGGKHYYSLAFKSGKESYELRNIKFKGCIGPKCITRIKEEEEGKATNKACVVFEGFFNFLSYKQLLSEESQMCITDYPCDYIILNSAGLAAHAQSLFDEYDTIHCYLDNDATGKAKTEEILERNLEKASDESYRYVDYNDLNDYLCDKPIEINEE